MKKILYVYKVTNLINDKIYVGKHSSNNINNSYMGSGTLIRKAIKKYGVSNFRKDILCICEDESEQNEMEILWISKLMTFENGYNLTRGGEGRLGYKPTGEQLTRAAESRRLYYLNNPRAREVLSEAAKRRVGNLNPFYGKKLSQSHIDKMTKTRVAAITGGNNPSAVAVRCKETGEVFYTAKDAAVFSGLKYSTTILKSAKGDRKTAGGFTWEIVHLDQENG